MTTAERIELIEQAMELVREAQDKVQVAVNGTSSEANFDAYGEYGFLQLLSASKPYDRGLRNLIDDFLEEEKYNK